MCKPSKAVGNSTGKGHRFGKLLPLPCGSFKDSTMQNDRCGGRPNSR